jgi:crotonobetainyl-CoA:carnitine CoA-transferase CaiB-like acyl-CoA transferase
MALAFGIAAALLKRGRTGEGAVVDVSLLGTAMWMLSSDLLAALNNGEAQPVTGRGPLVNPLTSTYRTKDDRHIQLMFLQGDRYWPQFCHVIGRPDLAADERFTDLAARRANAAACIAALDAVFAERTLAEWKTVLAALDAPWSPVQTIYEVADDPQVVANSYVGDVVSGDGVEYRLPTVPVQFDGRPPVLRRAPEHGEHTEAVLTELGYDWDRIGALADAGVIP